MARYTIELRNVIMMFGENSVKSWFSDYNLSDYLTDDEIAVITARGTWDKDKLAQAIIDHYYMYEIGFETPALFKHQAKVLMRELMEEKAPLIYSASIEYKPLVDSEETYSGETGSNTTGESSVTSSGLTVNSDTPQGQITKANILAGNYASSTGANESTTGTEDNSETTGTQEYTRTIKGNAGRMLKEYRKNIIMINRDIIKDVGSLFMIVY